MKKTEKVSVSQINLVSVTNLTTQPPKWHTKQNPVAQAVVRAVIEKQKKVQTISVPRSERKPNSYRSPVAKKL